MRIRRSKGKNIDTKIDIKEKTIEIANITETDSPEVYSLSYDRLHNRLVARSLDDTIIGYFNERDGWTEEELLQIRSNMSPFSRDPIEKKEEKKKTIWARMKPWVLQHIEVVGAYVLFVTFLVLFVYIIIKFGPIGR